MADRDGGASGSTPRRIPGSAALFSFLLALSVVPFWWSRFVPMIDVPGHLAVARIISGLHEPALPFGNLYALRLRFTPFLGSYAILLLLGKLLPWEVAGRVLASVLVVSLPLSVMALSRALGRSRWLALFALPLAYSLPVYYGLFNYLLGVALLLAALAAYASRLSGRLGGRAGDATLLLLPLALLATHAVPFVFFLCGLGVLAASLRGPWRRTLLFAAPALAVFAAWFVSVFVTGPGSVSAGGHEALFVPLLDKLTRLPENLTDQFRDPMDSELLAVFGVLVVAAFATGIAAERKPARDSIAAWLLAGGGVAAYVVLPGLLRIGAVSDPMFFQRFALLAALLCVVAIPLRPGAFPRALIAALTALSVTTSVYLCAEFGRFDREASGFETLASSVEPGWCVGTLAPYVRTNVFRTRLMYLHFASYLTIWRDEVPGDNWLLGPMPLAPRGRGGGPAEDAADAIFPQTDPLLVLPWEGAHAFGPFYRYFVVPREMADPAPLVGLPAGSLIRRADGGPFALFENPAGTCRPAGQP